MDSPQNFKVIGLMSGTSLDGLDIAYCHFKKNEKGWSYAIKKATTVKYPATWIQHLSTAQNLSGEDLIALDAAYGQWLGKTCAAFMKQNKVRPDFIASHGHTIFHQPRKGFTYQLGNGNALHAACGVPVVCDFRTLDVSLGGEGAPLVPAGDKFLFQEYDVCLNLGGIANLSVDVNNARRAYDVCFNNMGLNYLALKTGKTFDKDGAMASDGKINAPMLKALNTVNNALKKKRPSLGREIFEQRIQPILDMTGIPTKDKLHTFAFSSAQEIAEAIRTSTRNARVLCTGGGAFNAFFISQLLDACADDAQLVIPEDDIIKFKEALVFAFLGVLRTLNEVNCLQSVTGAKRDSSAGIKIGF